VPVLQGIASLSAAVGNNLVPVSVLAALALIVLPFGLSLLTALISRAAATTHSLRENLCRHAMALAPLGFGMWLAHFVFHFFTAALTPVPVFQRIAVDLGWSVVAPVWTVASWAFYDLPGLELLLLDAGFLLTLYLLWRVSSQLAPGKKLSAFLPWGALATVLYATGVWIIFQPMEMRGTFLH